MPVEHVVEQGETLTRIAKQYGLTCKKLSDHPDNAALCELRTDTNILLPGDVVNIPDKTTKMLELTPDTVNVFVLVEKPERFIFKMQDAEGQPVDVHKATLVIAGNPIDATISDDQLSCILPLNADNNAMLNIWLSDQEAPDESIPVSLGYLDPVETLSGVQARCNALGYECGVVDGLMGANTRRGVRGFQTANALAVDGDPGPNTQSKLKDVFGS